MFRKGFFGLAGWFLHSKLVPLYDMACGGVGPGGCSCAAAGCSPKASRTEKVMEQYLEAYNTFLAVMAVIALGVFVALHFFEAGYGYLFDRRYGPPVPNKVGWVMMESPVFIMMWVLWACSDRMWDAVPLTLLAMFQLHYFQRSFVFPLLMRGRSKMPLGIVVMGMIFNTLNALMQGGWIFYFAPEGYYDGWFGRPFIYVGAALFFAGMFINLHSDYIIRHLRKEGDTRHYIPRGGMFR